MSKIYVLGNPLLKEDSLAHKLLPKLRDLFPEISFINLDPTENLPEEDHLLLLDVVLNAKQIMLIKDIKQIASGPRYSVHDFDLGFQLQLMQKLGKLQDFTIIGLPPFLRLEDALQELKKIIPSLLSKSEKRN